MFIPPDTIHVTTELVRLIEAAALAVVSLDPVGAVRLALLASELRGEVVR